MTVARKAGFGPAAALLAVAGPALAHHSFAMFDRSKQLSLTGTVAEFQYTNPHSWIKLGVVPTGGAAQVWDIEALSPNVLSRAGWKRNTLKPGDKVTVLINPLRDGGLGGNLVTVTLPNGVVMGGGA